MVGRRIVYGVALLAALALQIFYDGYLAQFLLICVIALPLLSLALSLRGVIGVHLELTPSASQLVQGESGQWQIAAHTRSFLPVARLTMVVTLENRLTGDRQRQRLKTSGLSRGMARTLPMDTSHCGQLTCQLHRVRALDLLGLFAFPVSTPALVHALVLPQPAPTEDLPPLPQMPAGDSLKWRGTPSIEDYDLREYRPGDPLRSIHWKLSSKHDSLVVREPVKTGLPQVAVIVDLFGDGDRLDQVLGRLWTVCLNLLGREIPHTIVWMDRDQAQRQEAVASQAQFLAAMADLLSCPAWDKRPGSTSPLERRMPHESRTPGQSSLCAAACSTHAPVPDGGGVGASAAALLHPPVFPCGLPVPRRLHPRAGDGPAGGGGVHRDLGHAPTP